MKSVEIEKTYLVKYIPDNLKNFNNKEILDIYIFHYRQNIQN